MIIFKNIQYNSIAQRLLSILAPALESQITLSIGFFITTCVSLFYLYIGDPRYPTEKILIPIYGLLVSLLCFVIGNILAKKFKLIYNINLAQGALIVLLSWIIACSISSSFFILAGFPMPDNNTSFSLIRKFIDGFFESMSGFTTTGTSILPNVEIFARSTLFWRSLTHWIGGMGIAYMAVTLWRGFFTRRAEIINAEAESPQIIYFKNDKDARIFGYDFLKTYGLMSLICFSLLSISGYYFRSTPYLHFYDNIFDSLTTMFATLGTGGFMVYNSSVGLPIIENGVVVTGGLRNIVSEWIIAVFMMFSAMNFGLWYIVFFQKERIKTIFQNKELRVFISFIVITTLCIWYLLNRNFTGSVWDNFRFAFFNVTNIISTTGFANFDFAVWPVAAQGILFSCYLIGSCVGSTGGGLKFTRYLVFFRYSIMQIKNIIHGENETTFIIDGIKYDEKSAGFILVNIIVYYGLFLLGAILIMASSSKIMFTDGTIENLDFVSGLVSSISNLGNIGPSIVNGAVKAGPTGNYAAFSMSSKILMIFLMYLGRVGVLSFLMFFMTNQSEKERHFRGIDIDFDSDAPFLLR